MNNLTKRLLVLAALIIVMAMLPVMALADEITVTPQTLDTTDFTQSGTYKFEGTFGDLTVAVGAGADITLDGSAATVTGKIKITLGRIADSYTEVADASRSGNYTIQGFTTASSMSVGGNKVAKAVIKNNSVAAMDLDCSNCAVELTGNQINSTGSSYTRYNGTSTFKGGLYVYADNYALTLTGNTITAQNKAVSVQGNYDQFQNGRDTSGFGNTIIMTGNKLKANGILKVWNDVAYAPVEWPAEYTATEKMKTLASQIVNANTVSVSCQDAVVDVLMRSSAASDQNSTEKNFAGFEAAIAGADYERIHPEDKIVEQDGWYICSVCETRISQIQPTVTSVPLNTPLPIVPTSVPAPTYMPANTPVPVPTNVPALGETPANMPKTGDNSPLALFAALMVLSAAGVLFLRKRSFR